MPLGMISKQIFIYYYFFWEISEKNNAVATELEGFHEAATRNRTCKTCLHLHIINVTLIWKNLTAGSSQLPISFPADCVSPTPPLLFALSLLFCLIIHTNHAFSGESVSGQREKTTLPCLRWHQWELVQHKWVQLLPSKMVQQLQDTSIFYFQSSPPALPPPSKL